MKNYILLIIVVFLFKPVFSQNEEVYNADSLLNSAQRLAFEGKYEEAISLTEDILLHYPDYKDARMLLARSQAWSGDYSSAHESLNVLLSDEPENYELKSLSLDFYMWAEEYGAALEVADEILLLKQDDIPTLEKKAKLYMEESKPVQALIVLDKLSEVDPGNALVSELKNPALELQKAQEDALFNADSLLIVSQQLAWNGEYEESIAISESILDRFPDYKDARLLLSRTLAWSEQYEPAHENLNVLLSEEPDNYELKNLSLDFFMWEEDFDSALEVAEELLDSYPNDTSVLEKKANIYLAEGNEKELRSIIEELEDVDPEGALPDELRSSLKYGGKKNIIRLEYYYDTFNKPYSRDWHMSSVGYGRSTSVGDYYAKVYWGDMVEAGESLFSDNISTQYSFEFYPELNENNYMFLNYSFSGDDYFPKNRFGIEYHHVFKRKLDLSLGYRYLQFSKELEDDLKVNIYTGSISYYAGKYWLSARPYIIDDGDDISSQYTLSIRRFLPKDESYLELVLGTGVSPDDPFFYTSGQDIPNLNSWRVELEWKQMLGQKFIMELEGAYENAEYQSGLRRDQYTFRTSLSYLF